MSATDHLKLSLTNYLRVFHGNQADFNLTCDINGCQRRFTYAGTFQNHVYAVHKQHTFKSHVNEDHRMAEDNYSSYNDTVECSEVDTLQSVSNDMRSVTPPSLFSII